MELLSDLNPAQLEAVTHVEGPLLVLAGAGSGKTRVVTRRVAYLIEQGIPPRTILAITFTNKAAGEMRERIEQLVPGSPVWVTTFHKVCARLLRMYGSAVGLREGFVIYDTSDRMKILKEAMSKVNVDPHQVPPDAVEHAISRAKNDLLDPEAYARRANDYFESHVARIYPVVQEMLLAANAVDFDDLLLHVATMLRDNPELRSDLDARYRYLLIDEYQDTNLAQYAIVRALSTDYSNVCATGDPDQSIYGWRGANVRNILSFEDDFPEARVVRLEKNYRSTKRILAAASHLIQFNQRRKPKDLITDNPDGVPVQVTLYADERDEARSIAAAIDQAVASGTRRYSDFAIFFRVAALTRSLEMALASQQVPYQVLSGLSFFDRAEVKDLLAYLKLLINPRDDVAFARVVNVPARGIGKSTIERLHVAAETTGESLFEVARRVRDIIGIRARQADSILSFVRLMDELGQIGGHCVAEIIQQVLARTRYFEEALTAADPAEADDRRANVEELLSAAHRYDLDNPEGSLVEFLTESVLATDLDVWDESRDAVSLMTLHAAKGLEFPVVHVVAVEQGLLPHSRSTERDDVEEERRLLFVGMTRAREELRLSYTCRRDFRGKETIAIPSQFLGELPPGTAPPERESARSSREAPPPVRTIREPQPAALGRIVAASELTAQAPATTVDINAFTEGMLVRHPMYGLGRVAALSGYGTQRKAIIRFTTGDSRTFVLCRSPLKPVKAS